MWTKCLKNKTSAEKKSMTCAELLAADTSRYKSNNLRYVYLWVCSLHFEGHAPWRLTSSWLHGTYLDIMVCDTSLARRLPEHGCCHDWRQFLLVRGVGVRILVLHTSFHLSVLVIENSSEYARASAILYSMRTGVRWRRILQQAWIKIEIAETSHSCSNCNGAFEPLDILAISDAIGVWILQL